LKKLRTVNEQYLAKE